MNTTKAKSLNGLRRSVDKIPYSQDIKIQDLRYIALFAIG